MPGKKYASLKHPKLYEKLREEGYTKESAAKISNSPKRTGKKQRSR